jgi:hypothetical protein
VAVDWGSITFGAAAPLMLVHGTHADHTSWEYAVPNQGSSLAKWIPQNIGVDSEYQSIDLKPFGDGTFESNAQQLKDILTRETARRGVQSIHLVTHSKGASDSRYMLAKLYQPGKPFRVLTLFSLGTPSKGTIASDYAVEAEKVVDNRMADPKFSQDPLAVSFFTDVKIAALLGAPVDPARQLQRVEPMRMFNQQTPKVPGVSYYSLAGNADGDDHDLILQLPEIDGFLFDHLPLPGFLPSATGRFEGDQVAVLVCNRLYRAMGRAKSIKVQTQVVPGPNLVTQYSVVQAVLAPNPPAPNDLVSTAASTNCTECGFIPLGDDTHTDAIYPYNHTALKNPLVMQVIWDKITEQFPVELH